LSVQRQNTGKRVQAEAEEHGMSAKTPGAAETGKEDMSVFIGTSWNRG